MVSQVHSEKEGQLGFQLLKALGLDLETMKNHRAPVRQTKNTKTVLFWYTKILFLSAHYLTLF